MTEAAADYRQQPTDTHRSNGRDNHEGKKTVRYPTFIGEITKNEMNHFVQKTIDSALVEIVKRTCSDIKQSIEDGTQDKERRKNIDLFSIAERILVTRVKLRMINWTSSENVCTENPELHNNDSSPYQVFSDAYDEDDYPAPDVNDKPRGRGRPVVTQLCSMFRDAAIWPMVKTIFRRIYKKSIQQATNLAQYLTCFLCGLFRIAETEEPYGKVSYFHKLMKGHFTKAMMPAVRTLQTGVQWLKDKTKTCFRCAKQTQEEAKHKAWEVLEDIIYGHLVELAPQYAM